jgi:hypothetical protein
LRGFLPIEAENRGRGRRSEQNRAIINGRLTDDIVAALVDHGVRRVLVAYDRDAAGDKGAAAVAERPALLGIGVYRVNFPKGMDTNAYALSVTPAAKSLGALLRAAEWMAGTEGVPAWPCSMTMPPPWKPFLSQPLRRSRSPRTLRPNRRTLARSRHHRRQRWRPRSASRRW